MSEQPAAGAPSSAAPAWFTALTAPASAPPTEDPVAETPEMPVPPAPDAPVAAEAPAPDPATDPAPTPEPEPDPELETLRRQTAEANERIKALEAEREQQRQAEADAERQRARDEYWARAEATARDLDTDDERIAYMRQAADELARQEGEANRQADMERAVADAARGFPDYIGKEYGLEPWQVQYLHKLNENPNKMVAGSNMAAVAVAFKEMNADPARKITKDAALESYAAKTAADIAASGALATAPAVDASPAPTVGAKPTTLRPGSRESADILGNILFAPRR